MADMLSKAKAVEDYVIKMRRTFHANPELSSQEFETQKIIMAELDAMGIPYEKSGNTSVVAKINPGKGKIVALRGDTDALPVLEQTGVDYASTVPGKMHACGHDAHTAMLLGAAKVLSEMKDTLPGEVRLIFQEAEETFTGAQLVIKDGHLKDVEVIFGMHGMSALATGKYDVTPGYRMAACDTLYIKFEGVSGHGSTPHLAKDTIHPACMFVNDLQGIVAKNIDSQKPIVLSVGRFSGGTKANIIAKYTEMDISMRYFDPQVRKTAHEAIKRHAQAIADMYEIAVTIDIEEGAISLYNDPNFSLMGQKAAEKVMGAENYQELSRFMGSEDMAYYGEVAPVVYAFMGYYNEAKETIYFPHHEKFNLDEDYFKYGVALHTQFVMEFFGIG